MFKRLDIHGRTCTKCGEYKLWEEYGKGHTYGHKPSCKVCRRKQDNIYNHTKRDLKKHYENVRRSQAKKKAEEARNVQAIQEDNPGTGR